MSILCLARTRLLCICTILLLSTASLPLLAQVGAPSTSSDIAIGTITAPKMTATPIGIPTFEPKGQRGGIEAGFFRDIIYRDLEWFSHFERAKNQTFVDQTQRRDARTGKVDFVEWGRLELNFVLKGEFESKRGKISAEVRLYDVAFRTWVYGLRYEPVPLSEARQLAHRIADDVVKAVYENAIPIANTQVVYVSRSGHLGKQEVYIVDADGANRKQLTHDGSTALTPCWGKNGTEIYYTTYKDTNPDLCGVQIGSRRQWFVSMRPGANYAPCWNPRTERVALTLGRHGNDEIYSMDRSGRENTLRRLTFSISADTSASWNPAGNQVVFNSDRSGTPQIYVMAGDGTNVRRLTRQGRYNVSPVWSPLDNRIAFVGRQSGRFDIYTMNVDGTQWRRLTHSSGDNEDPSWAPDGRHMVFASNRTGKYQLYIMRDDGSNQQQITTQGVNQSPSWSPVPY
jgi:TolB protein